MATTEPYREGTADSLFGTSTVYDDDGRVEQTQRVKGIVVNLTGSGANIRSVLANAGTLVASTGTTYGTANRVTQTADENGLVTQYTYGPFGETTQTRRQTVNENGQTAWLLTRTVFDSFGRAVLATDEYLEGATDPIYATATEYDDLGRSHKSIRRQSVVVNLNATTGATTLANAGTAQWNTQTVYDDKGRVARNIGADGQNTDYVYDELDRRVAVLAHPQALADAGLTPQDVGLMDGTNVTVRQRSETMYNAEGQVEKERRNVRHVILANGTVQVHDEAAQDTMFEYDERGNLIKTIFDDSTFISAVYDELGRKQSETNPLGLTRDFEYDVNDRLKAVVQPAVFNPATGLFARPRYEYGYDAEGNQTLLRDPLLRETRWQFNEQGWQLKRTLPLGFGADGIQGTADDPAPGAWQETMVYDDRGRQTLQVSFEGVHTQFVYHPQTGRLSEQRFFDNLTQYANGAGTPSEVWLYQYDAFGRQTRVERTLTGSASHVTTYQYDGEHRMTQMSAPEGIVSYQYDALGRRTFTHVGTVAAPVRSVGYSYDALGRVKTVTETGPGVTSYRYDLVGNMDRVDMPNGVITDYVYDALNRLDVLTHYAPDATPEDLSNNTKLAEFHYTVRADGRRTQAQETIGATTNTFTWDYDALGRLTSEGLDSSDNSLDYTATYQFDLAGNRLQYVKGATTITSSYDVNDRLLTETPSTGGSTVYGYAQTQQTSKTVTAADGTKVITTFSYDLQGRYNKAHAERELS